MAPVAAAAPGQTCTNNGGATICTRPGGSTSINASPPPVVGPYNDCGYGVGMEYMCDGGVSWNIGGIFRGRN